MSRDHSIAIPNTLHGLLVTMSEKPGAAQSLCGHHINWNNRDVVA